MEVVIWMDIVIEIRMFGDVADLKLQQCVDQLIDILISPDQISFNDMSLPYLNPFPLLFFLN
jgi:hypothetical protein